MGKAVTIGLDIAKSVFQVHGVDDRTAVLMLATQLHLVNEHILELDRAIKASAKATEVGRRPPALGRWWQARSWRRSLIRKASSQAGTWRRGSPRSLAPGPRLAYW